MDFAEFTYWTEQLVEQGELTNEEAIDVRRQRRLFDERRPTLEARYQGAVVGYVADELLIAGDTVELLDRARLGAPGNQVYFEEMPEWSASPERGEFDDKSLSLVPAGVAAERRSEWSDDLRAFELAGLGLSRFGILLLWLFLAGAPALIGAGASFAVNLILGRQSTAITVVVALLGMLLGVLAIAAIGRRRIARRRTRERSRSVR